MPRASNNGHRIKVAWILGGLVGCCGLLGLATWNLTGIGPSERRAAELYAEVQALGVPLDTDAYEKSLEVPADQNNAPELTSALAALYEYDHKHAGELKTTRLFTWHDGPDISSAEQARLLAAHEGPLNAVTDHIDRPHFVIKRDWVSALMVRLPEYARFRLAVKLCGAKAVSEARLGHRPQSLKSLHDAFKLGTLAGDSPTTYIAGLSSISCYAISVQSVVRCIQLDPAGTEAYSATIPDKAVRPVGLYIRGEVFMFVGGIRNLTWQTELKSLYLASEGKPIPPEKYHQRNGPPTDPFVRAEVGYGLKRWLPLLRALNKDGTPKDQEDFERQVAEFSKDVDMSSGFLGGAFQVMSPDMRQAVQSWTGAEVQRDLARAYVKVVLFRELNGRWPSTLPEAGVTQLDRLSPKPRPFGYRVEPGGMRIWTVGRDGEDNGGLTSQELKSKPGAARDIVFVFREGLNRAK